MTLLWQAYGVTKRGLSMRVTMETFKEQWLPASMPDGLDTPLYFRRRKYVPSEIDKTPAVLADMIDLYLSPLP